MGGAVGLLWGCFQAFKFGSFSGSFLAEDAPVSLSFSYRSLRRLQPTKAYFGASPLAPFKASSWHREPSSALGLFFLLRKGY